MEIETLVSKVRVFPEKKTHGTKNLFFFILTRHLFRWLHTFIQNVSLWYAHSLRISNELSSGGYGNFPELQIMCFSSNLVPRAFSPPQAKEKMNCTKVYRTFPFPLVTD